MVDQNLEFIQELLLSQIDSARAEILAAFSAADPQSRLSAHFQTGTRFTDDGKVVAYLAFDPGDPSASASLDLNMCLECTPRGAVFSSEISWSNGKIIDEALVCNFCPDCLEQLCEEVEQVLNQKRTQLVNRMVELLSNFQFT